MFNILICIKDTWTKSKRGRNKGGKWGWLGWGREVGEKWRQLHLTNNKKNVKKYINKYYAK